MFRDTAKKYKNEDILNTLTAKKNVKVNNKSLVHDPG